MVLQMTRPWKHPDSGIFYFRKRVPQAFRARIRRAIVKVSLNTRDPGEAKRRHAEMALAIAEEWAALMRAPEVKAAISLSEKQLHALAGELYAEVVAQHENNPGDPDQWERKLGEIQTCIPFAMREPDAPRDSKVFGENAPRGMVSSIVRPWLAQRQLNLDAPSRANFTVIAAMGLARAYKRLLQLALGDGSDDPNRFPAFEAAAAQTGGTWQDLYAGYLLECKPAASTQKRQRGVISALFKFLGHDDPARVSKADMIRWKEHCLTLNKRGRTVRDADIAHPKTLFTWAFDEGKLPLNPAAGVRVRVNDEAETRDREFTYDEARAILAWSLVPAGGRISVDRAAAIRWIPWICLYSGARVNEITQARAKDVCQLKVPEGDPVWVIRITPEAGPIKGNRRDVPLHPHLIEQGFLDYVRSRKGKCLFYDPGRARGGAAGNPISRKVGEALRGWVRLTCGVSDPGVSPNHGWRHYFRSACTAVDIQEHIIDGIDGHKPTTVARKYGSLWPKVAYDNILRLPRIIVKPAIDGEQIVGAPGGQGRRPRTKRGAPRRPAIAA